MLTVVLNLTRAQAEAVHDLLVDADMHEGAVTLPMPLPAGTHEAVAEPILAAIREQDRALASALRDCVRTGAPVFGTGRMRYAKDLSARSTRGYAQ